MSWGDGAWPSMQFVHNLSTMTRIFSQSYPSQVSLDSLYGYAFQYADKKYNKGHYTGSLMSESDPESLNRYLKEAAECLKVMNFKVYVPKGFSKIGKASLPNLEETIDPERIFTALFPDENWKI